MLRISTAMARLQRLEYSGALFPPHALLLVHRAHDLVARATVASRGRRLFEHATFTIYGLDTPSVLRDCLLRTESPDVLGA